MRWIAAIVLPLALVYAAACADGAPPPPTPEGPTTLSLAKTMRRTQEGDLGFTLALTNVGDNAAVNVVTSDVWEEGLEMTEVEPVEGQEPKVIGDFGLEVIFQELQAGKSVQIRYTARCRESGEWENTAAVSSANAEPDEVSLTVVCP